MIAAGDDPVRTYTPEEDERIARNLRACTEDVHRGVYRERRLELGFLCEIHARLFHEVRDHAGRYRCRDFGSERLTFGPNRSPHRDEVEARLTTVFQKLQRSVDSFLDNPDAEEYEEAAIHVAMWVHAELIRIHPFEDGNGRASRLFANAVLVTLGLRPIALESCKQEYYECLNLYMRDGDLSALIDLNLRLYPLARPFEPPEPPGASED